MTTHLKLETEQEASTRMQAEQEFLIAQSPTPIKATAPNIIGAIDGTTVIKDSKVVFDVSRFFTVLPNTPRQRAEELIISQYQAAPNFLAYVDAYMEEISELTNAMIATYVYRYPTLAFGAMLDTIAEIVGCTREIPGAAPLGLFGFYEEPASFGHKDATKPESDGGRLYSLGEQLVGDLRLTDEELRRYIQARIIVNTQIPTVDMLYAYTDLLYGSEDPRWELREAYASNSADTCKADMHFNGYLNIQERAFFSAVYLRFKVSGVKLTLSDTSGDIELLQP